AATGLPVEAFVISRTRILGGRGLLRRGVPSVGLLRRFHSLRLLGRSPLSGSLLGRGLFGRSLLGLRLLGRSLLGSLFRRLFLGLLVLLFVCHQTLSSCSRSIPRSFATVSSRATSLRTAVMRDVFSSSPVACWRRSANCSSRVWRMRSTSSSSLRLCASEDFMTAAPCPRGGRTWSLSGG